VDATGALLRRLGARVRARRKELDLTAAALAERAGLSRRFVAQVEAGEGNIAIGRLHDVATALDTTIEALVTDGRAAAPRRAIERLVGELDPDQQRRALQLLQLAFGLGLTVEETQELLKIAQKSPLYPKLLRDAAVMRCLYDQKTIDDAQVLLAQLGLTRIGEGDRNG